MASLLGKADSTLVQGAYKAAMADVPGDLSKVYASEVESMKTLMTSVGTMWDGLNKEWDDRNKALTDKGDDVYENVLGGKYNDAMVSATDDAVQDISKRLKGQKRDKKGVKARKIEAEMSMFGKNTTKNAELFTELADLSRNNGLIVNGSGVETKLLEAIFDDFNNNTNNTNLAYKDGDFVYTFEGKSMTMRELNKSITRKNNAPPIAVQKVFNKVASDAVGQKRLADDSYKNDIKGRIKGFMGNSSDKTNVMHHKFEGLEYSFFDALTGKDEGLQNQIFNTLLALDTDIDKDGVVDTRATYLNPENAVALQSEILNSPDSDEIIAGFLTDNLFQDAYNRGKLERKTDVSNPTGTPRTPSVVANIKSLQASVSSGGRIYSGTGTYYEYDADSKGFLYYSVDSDDFKSGPHPWRNVKSALGKHMTEAELLELDKSFTENYGGDNPPAPGYTGPNLNFTNKGSLD